MSAAIFMSSGESAALNFGRERRVSGAHKNDERTKGLNIRVSEKKYSQR